MTELVKTLKNAPKEALLELAELTALNKTTFVAGEPYQSAYNEGIRSIGLKLLALAEQDVTETVTNTYKQRKLKWKK